MDSEGPFQYQHARQPNRIIDAALSTLGLSRAYLAAALGLVEPAGGRGWTGDDMSAIDWLRICRFLHLSADSFSCGYSSQEHRGRIFYAFGRGEIRFPRTPELVALAKRARERRRQELLWRRDHMGLRLRLKARWQELTEQTFQRLACRLRYLDLPRLSRCSCVAVPQGLQPLVIEGSGK
jgi:hypothetical protein